MTTRGNNPSNSPPVQIPQSRHVSTIQSGTPPPNQQLYQGQSPGLVQGTSFNYIQPQYQQGEPLLPYQAYGSAPNDLRGASVSSGRGGAGPANMAQSGAYYHQPNQNMRPSQPPPPSHTHAQQYFIGQSGQNTMRHARPTHPSNPAMFLIPQNNNMVISANMYQPAGRMPMYAQSGPQYQRYPGQGMVYFNGGIPRPSVPMQTQGMGPPPQPREKRIITISDPNTGRNITDELFKSQHHPSSEEKNEPDDSSANDKGVEIRKNFTRQVVERMKTGEVAPSPQPSTEPVNPPPPVAPSQNQPSQEHPQHPSYQSGPPQQQQSTPPLTGAAGPGMMRPQMRMASPINLSVPPPQLPPSMYSNPRHAQSQPTMSGQVQTNIPLQTQQQVLPPKGPLPPSSSVVKVDSATISRSVEPSLSASPPVIDRKPMPTQAEPVIPQSDIPTHKPPVAAAASIAPVQQVERPTLSSAVAQENHPSPQPSHTQKPIISSQAQDPVPATVNPQSAAPVAVEQNVTPVMSVAPAPVSTSVPVSTPQPPVSNAVPSPVESKPVTVETKQPSPEPTKQPVIDTDRQSEGREETGANTQGNKDGRKGKKNKKDFSRKESGGSEMDAFIDESNTTMNNDSAARVADKATATEKTIHETITPKQVSKSDNFTTPLQVENKSKVKKKKKKKGKKGAPSSSKAKFEEPEDDNSEKNFESTSEKGKDSGVDIESSQTASEPLTSSENQPQNEATVVTSSVSNPVSKNDEQEAIVKEPSPVPVPVVEAQPPEPAVPVEETKPDKYVAEKETEVVKSDTAKNQNGIELPQDSRLPMEKQASVPKDDSPVVNSVPEENPVNDHNDDDDDQQMNEEDLLEENGTPKIEEIELSKAELFANLKKSGGKLVYDRAYLMELRECASSQTKPDGLPELDIILDRPNPALSRQSGGPADFTPAFFQTATNQRHPPPIGKSSSRGRQRPGDMPGTPRVIKSISMSNDSKALHQSENPWKLSTKSVKDEKRTLEGEILFIMNRITPTNFEKMAVEMKKLDVKTYDDLKFMVKIFFDKVTIETKFVEAYAQLCKVMSGLKVPPPADGSVKDHMATFRVVMLTKCQQEFEADKSIIFEDPAEKKKKLEAENPEKTPEQKEKIDGILYQMKLRRMKFYGNIRFIGELFKLGMLTESIMHDCIFRLLKARDDDSLVSLCNLLTTVGRNLDIDKAKPRMDQYFSQMGKIADERKSRIKFTLRDVIELRQNYWVPRKEVTGPKKIDEVHKDFAQEQARNQFLASQPLPPRNDNNQAGSRKGSRQRQDENKPNDEGWNTVSSKSVRMIDASKMKISKNVVDDNIQLGPGGGIHKQALWGRGSHGGAQPSQDDRSSGSNRFSALTSDDSRRPFPRSPSRGEGSAGRSMRQGPTAGHGRGKIMSRSSQEGERRDAIANARSFMGGRSQNSSRDNSWNRDDRRTFVGPRSSGERDNPMTRSDSGVRMEEFRAPAPPAVKQMTESEIETKAVNIIDEYLNIRDLGEAKLCVKELVGQNHLYLMVTACMNNVLEKRDEARNVTGSFFHQLVTSNVITANTYIKGLNEVLQYASDMVVDIPTLWNCLAQLICPLLVEGSLQWSMLKQAWTPYLDNKDGAKLLASVLSQCVEKQGEKEVAQKWQSSGLSWSTYLKGDEVTTFVNDKKLGFTLGGSSTGSLDIEKMIRSRAPTKDLISYIEKTVPGSKADNNFIRALTTAIVSASITENKNLSEEVFKVYKDVLQKYIGNKVDLQLQALYAIQTLMAKLEHPSGVLYKLFELLYYDVSMEEEAFYRWEKCDDPQEQEAKGTCLLQVRQFFIWLRENEEPES